MFIKRITIFGPGLIFQTVLASLPSTFYTNIYNIDITMKQKELHGIKTEHMKRNKMTKDRY